MPPLLSAETLDLMKTPEVPFPELPEISIGMNWAIQEVEGRRLAHHNGATFSQNAATALIPEEDFAFVMFTSATSGSAGLAAVRDAAFAEYLGITGAAGNIGGGVVEADDDAGAAHTPDELSEYVGQYQTPDTTFTVSAKGEGLNLDIEVTFPPDTVLPDNNEAPPSGIPLTFSGPDRAVIGTDAAPVGICAFVRDTDGSVGWMSFGNHLHRRTGSA